MIFISKRQMAEALLGEGWFHTLPVLSDHKVEKRRDCAVNEYIYTHFYFCSSVTDERKQESETE